MYSLEQLRAMRQKAESANDMQAVMTIDKEIANTQKKAQQSQQQQAQQQQMASQRYEPEQLKAMLQKAQQANDESAVTMINNEIANTQVRRAGETQALQEAGSAPGAFFADMGAMFSKTLPNLKRLVSSEDSDSYREATKEIEKIEQFQDRLRTAFPSAVFGGEVAAPGATMAATAPLGPAAGLAAGVTEAAAFTPAQGDPRISAAVGAGAPIAGGVGLKAAEKVGGALGMTVDNVVSTLYRSPEDEAARGVRRYLAEAGVEPSEVITEYQQLGPNAVLADVDQLRGVSQYAAMTPAGRPYKEIMEKRQSGQRDRILSEGQKILGTKADDFRGTMSSFIAKRQQNAAPLYESAMNRPFTTSDDPDTWGELLERVRGSGAIGKGKSLSKTDGYEFDPENLTSRELHYIKLGLDSKIEKAVKAGERTTVRSLTNLKDDYLTAFDDANPDYAAARNQFSSDSAVITAQRLGKDLFRPKEDGRLLEIEEMGGIVSNYGSDELAAFQQGAIKAISDKLNKLPDTADSARRFFRNKNTADALRVAFPDPEQFDKYLRFLKKESEFTDTLRDLYQGSQTAQRQTAERSFRTGGADIQGTSVIDVAKNLLGGKLSDEGQQALARMMFDKNTDAVDIQQMMVRSGILPDNVAIDTVRRMRENWPEIYRSITSIDPGVQFTTSGAMAPFALQEGSDILSGEQR